MELSKLPIIVFDGHDGVGKTTLAKALAKSLGTDYVRPFEGNRGIELIAAAEVREYGKVLKIGKTAIERKYRSVASSPLIFDRHWLTVLSLVPKTYRKCWPGGDVMHSFLCTASLKTIKMRLEQREEEKFDDAYHDYYLKKYLEIAKECKYTVLNTDQLSVDEILKNIELQIRINS